jgi:A118 family predicted phage portal protein
MWTKILQWLREVWLRMINQSDVKQALKLDVAISQPMVDALRTWSNAYINQAPWLTTVGMKSLNLPAAIAGELSRAITIEMAVKVAGSPRADFLQAQVDAFTPKLREQVEYAAAKGGMVMKPYVDGDRIIVDFVQADQFYPITFDSSGRMTACVFSDQRTVGDRHYTRLEFHRMEGGSYFVQNQAFRSGTKDTLGVKCELTEVDAWAKLTPEATITGIRRPLFAYFKYPLANNIDPASPLGVSCYARAMDLIKQADQQWTDFLWEFESGKRALYVDEAAFDRGKDGKPILPSTRLYRTLKMAGDVDGKELFEEWTPDLREANMLAGLDAMLRKIEFNVGLAYGTLSNPATIEKTATELKISQQRSYATVNDAQKALSVALDELVYAMDVWVTLTDLAPKGVYVVTSDFDDSIIVDRDTQFINDLRLVATNIMSKWEFRVRNLGEDEETARDAVDEAVPEPEPIPGFYGAQTGGKPAGNGKPAGRDKKTKKEAGNGR